MSQIAPDPLRQAANRLAGVIEITLPMPPNLTNTRESRHWRAAEGRKKAYWKVLNGLYVSGALPRRPESPYERVRIASVMHLGAHMDDDNALARHKFLLDWLRHAKYIADDRKRNIEWAGLPEQVVKRGVSYRIVLTITPLVAP
jgi:hypothetical protein